MRHKGFLKMMMAMVVILLASCEKSEPEPSPKAMSERAIYERFVKPVTTEKHRRPRILNFSRPYQNVSGQLNEYLDGFYLQYRYNMNTPDDYLEYDQESAPANPDLSTATGWMNPDITGIGSIWWNELSYQAMNFSHLGFQWFMLIGSDGDTWVFETIDSPSPVTRVWSENPDSYHLGPGNTTDLELYLEQDGNFYDLSIAANQSLLDAVYWEIRDNGQVELAMTQFNEEERYAQLKLCWAADALGCDWLQDCEVATWTLEVGGFAPDGNDPESTTICPTTRIIQSGVELGSCGECE